MAAPLRRLVRLAAALGLALLIAAPLVWASALAVAAGTHSAAWRALWVDPQWPRALAMTLWTGLAATALSTALTAWVLVRSFPGPAWQRVVNLFSPMLAVPHAALAIGLVFLVAPSGWVLRALSPWATGFDAPPPWATSQDPWGLGLILALTAKETPFLLWAAATQLQRSDTGPRWLRELQLARSLGYAPQTAWRHVLWPQLWPRLAGPLIAVLAYSLTVVDMALVIGPSSPPTLAVLAWQWLLDADTDINAQGAAAAWLLAAVVGLVGGAFWLFRERAPWRAWRTLGRRGHAPAWRWPHPLWALGGLYLGVMLALAIGSISGVWPFPRVWPDTWSLQAWQEVVGSSSTLGTTITLALASSLTALVWALAWLECAPAHWDAALRRLIYLPLLLPSVLWVVGLHRLSLAWDLDAQWRGLWLAHSLAATPYVLISLSPAYLGFDARYSMIAASLGKGYATFLLRIKWPILKAALLSALAVGFAVSVAQYLPTLFVGAGRFNTVTTEAVTLASGAQRSLTAAYAWLQWLLPALMFAAAAWLGRPLRFGKMHA